MNKIINAIIIMLIKGIKADTLGSALVMGFIIGGVANSVLGFVIGVVIVAVIQRIIILADLDNYSGEYDERDKQANYRHS